MHISITETATPSPRSSFKVCEILWVLRPQLTRLTCIFTTTQAVGPTHPFLFERYPTSTNRSQHLKAIDMAQLMPVQSTLPPEEITLPNGMMPHSELVSSMGDTRYQLHDQISNDSVIPLEDPIAVATAPGQLSQELLPLKDPSTVTATGKQGESQSETSTMPPETLPTAETKTRSKITFEGKLTHGCYG